MLLLLLLLQIVVCMHATHLLLLIISCQVHHLQPCYGNTPFHSLAVNHQRTDIPACTTEQYIHSLGSTSAAAVGDTMHGVCLHTVDWNCKYVVQEHMH
jgi:hypothetical protein